MSIFEILVIVVLASGQPVELKYTPETFKTKPDCEASIPHAKEVLVDWLSSKGIEEGTYTTEFRCEAVGNPA